MKRFTNTGTLFTFALRRDRFFLPCWIIGIVLLAVLCAPLFTQVASTPEELAMYAETMKNPAMTALCGPLYAEPYTYSIMYTQMMVVWVLILIAVMNFFLVSRHTRKDEEDGKLEVLRSLPVGRLAILTSAWITTILTNLIIGILSTVGLIIINVETMTADGCILLGVIFFIVGMFFACVAMLFSQICSTSRGMTGGCFITLGILYITAAMGNVDGGALAYISPLSIIFKTSPFAENNIIPLFVIIAETLLLAVIAMQISGTRDLGAGLIPPGRGRAHASPSLSSPFGLALRLTLNTCIAWVIVMFILGVAYGSIFGDMEQFMSTNEMLQMVLATEEGGSMMASLITYITLIMSLIASIPVIQCVMKLRAEEKKNRLEYIYSTAVSKLGQFMPYILIAVCLSVLLQISMAVGMWSTANAVMDVPVSLADMIIAGLVKLPAIWILIGISVFLTGLLPKLTALVWLYFGFSFVQAYLGRMVNLPEIFDKISVFSVLPNYPVDEINAVTIVTVTAIAIILCIVGLISYARRDVR